MSDFKKKKVIVAMSSGVDSSVAAALLKKQGYEVIGVFMHFWKEPGQNSLVENKCCSTEAQEDARKVARLLDIPFYTTNASSEFKEKVVDYFIEENKAGRTPNPCVACNEYIKFNFLFKKMLEMEADFVATGHYAKIKEIDGKFHFYTSSDEEKDQTYFLYNLNQKQLGRIMFPIGGYKKDKVREMAKEMNIPVFDKDDSQGLCFTPEKYPTEFLKRHIKMKGGEIINTNSEVIGEHIGLQAYTIGQRRGINIGGDGPYYVAGKNFEKNQLIVTNNEKDPALYRNGVLVEIKNWTAGEPVFPLKCLVKIRYRHPAVCAMIYPVKSLIDNQGAQQFNGVNPVKSPINDQGAQQFNGVKKSKNANKQFYMVEFKDKQRAVTPGQSAVFYSKEGEVIGGGIITH